MGGDHLTMTLTFPDFLMLYGLHISSPTHQEHRGVCCLSMNIAKGHEVTEYFFPGKYKWILPSTRNMIE